MVSQLLKIRNFQNLKAIQKEKTSDESDTMHFSSPSLRQILVGNSVVDFLLVLFSYYFTVVFNASTDQQLCETAVFK